MPQEELSPSEKMAKDFMKEAFDNLAKHKGPIRAVMRGFNGPDEPGYCSLCGGLCGNEKHGS